MKIVRDCRSLLYCCCLLLLAAVTAVAQPTIAAGSLIFAAKDTKHCVSLPVMTVIAVLCMHIIFMYVCSLGVSK